MTPQQRQAEKKKRRAHRAGKDPKQANGKGWKSPTPEDATTRWESLEMLREWSETAKPRDDSDAHIWPGIPKNPWDGPTDENTAAVGLFVFLFDFPGAIRSDEENEAIREFFSSKGKHWNTTGILEGERYARVLFPVLHPIQAMEITNGDLVPASEMARRVFQKIREELEVHLGRLKGSLSKLDAKALAPFKVPSQMIWTLLEHKIVCSTRGFDWDREPTTAPPGPNRIQQDLKTLADVVKPGDMQVLTDLHHDLCKKGLPPMFPVQTTIEMASDHVVAVRTGEKPESLCYFHFHLGPQNDLDLEILFKISGGKLMAIVSQSDGKFGMK